jgi:hypothetical protein
VRVKCPKTRPCRGIVELRSGTTVLASKVVTVPAGRTVRVRLQAPVLATTSRQSSPARRVRVRTTGSLSATLAD